MNEQITPEVDDVEAHGLKEIAAGIVTVGAISTGGVALAASSGPSVPPSPIVQQAADDATAAAGHATGAITTLAADATGLAGHAADNAKATAASELTATEAFVDATRNTADRVVADNVSSIDRAVSDAARTAFSTANLVVTTAQGEVKTATDTATRTANTAQETANRTATTATSTALSVVRMVQDLANHWNVDVAVFGASVAADGSLTKPGGTITLTDGTGGVLATADIHDGTATLRFTTPSGSGSLTLHYPGDGLWGPTQLPLQLPPTAL